MKLEAGVIKMQMENILFIQAIFVQQIGIQVSRVVQCV
jgi:hypothetical protein